MATAHSDSSDSDYDDNNQQQHDSDWEDWDAAAGAGGAEGEDEEENDATRSLFDSSVLPSPAAALEYDAATHGFDLRQYRRQVRGCVSVGVCACGVVLVCVGKESDSSARGCGVVHCPSLFHCHLQHCPRTSRVRTTTTGLPR